MKSQRSVSDYISSSPWREGLEKLRGILLSTGIEETVKWGTPHYTHQGKTIIGMAGFKSYFSLWFHQGVFLKDPLKVLINAQEGTTRALRQWRFTNAGQIPVDSVRTYVLEAIKNQEQGMTIKPQTKAITFPDELKEALVSDTELLHWFDKLTPGRQREYAEHIASAKQGSTRLSRLDKCIPMIKSGKGLNDRYK